MRINSMSVVIVAGVLGALSIPAVSAGQSAAAGDPKPYIVNPWAQPRPGSSNTMVPSNSGGDSLEAAARGQTRDNTPIPPRKPWGAPDLEAPGTWAKRVGLAGGNNTAWQTQPLPFTKAGLFAFNDTVNHIDPQSFCKFPGVPRLMNSANYPLQIVQTPNLIVFVYEYMHNYRLIYLDRPHPKDILPSNLGHSVGRWEGDTLVVDTIGLNGDTWLDDHGNIHSDALHLIERYTRVSQNQIAYEATYDDPKFYTRPWTVSWYMQRNPPGLEILEYACTDFNYSLESGNLQKGPLDHSSRDGGPIGIPAGGRTINNTDPRTGQPIPPAPPAQPAR